MGARKAEYGGRDEPSADLAKGWYKVACGAGSSKERARDRSVGNTAARKGVSG